MRQIAYSREHGYLEYKKVFVQQVPIARTTKKTEKTLSNLTDCVVFARSDSKNSELAHISQFFEEVIDGCVFELYFAEHMKERGLNILDLVSEMMPEIESQPEEKKGSLIVDIFQSLRKSEVNTRLKLFTIKSPEILKPIIQS